MRLSMLFEEDELRDLRSVLLFVADSLRWDSFQRAHTPTLDRFAARQERRMSYASWTQPSHACILAGLLPHPNIVGSRAAEIYALDIQLWGHALGKNAEPASELYPHLCLAQFARDHGWNTVASVAMPVLNESTSFSRGFSEYSLSPQGGSIATQTIGLTPLLSDERDFVFVNAGETHYPYLLPRESMPRISGFRGAATGLVGTYTPSKADEPEFTAELLREMHASQVAGLERLDKDISVLVDRLRKPLLLIFVSDHGELFGEDGFVGHGPFFHRLLFDVPLAAGVIR
jgi:arylsulfatase A-like enzyme